MKNIDEIVSEIFSLYEKFGEGEYFGEAVTQLEHMSQSAELAVKEGYDDEVVLAAFFHDIGHICVARNESNDMQGLGILSHEKVGSIYLRKKGFPDKVIRLVEYHVTAKRYLTFRYPEYYRSLSEASRRTLQLQGGVMSNEEAAAFERDELFETSIAMRRWDELAKVPNIRVTNIEQMKALARKVLSYQA